MLNRSPREAKIVAMTHEEIRARLLGALDRVLDPQELDEVERHVEACAACRTEQVELHQMRRSLDREDRAREEARPLSRWGPFGLNGLMRIGALAIGLGVLAYWGLPADRAAPAPSSPLPLTPGLKRMELAGDPVPIRATPHGRVLAVAGPARVLLDLSAEADWDGARLSLGRGRCLLEGAWTLDAGQSGTLSVLEGRSAAWRSPSGFLEFQVISGSAVWRGPQGEVALVPGESVHLPAEASAPAWVGVLEILLIEEDAVDVVPGVRVLE